MTTSQERPTSSLDQEKFVDVGAYSKMDPRLQRIVARQRRGLPSPATVSTEPGEATVIAKVTDLDQWEGLSEVRIGATLAGSAANGTWLVTARLPVDRIEYVRQQSFVLSLKGPHLLQPMLDATTEQCQARPDLLPSGNQAEGGHNTVVGIVDYGMDFVHKNFRNPGGGTRLLAIWDQGGITGAGSPYGYGTEYTQDEINHALEQSDPYEALGYEPAPDTWDQRGTHGTHVSDIAAGNGRGSEVPGLAPRADIVFVDVSHADIPFAGPSVVGSSFGDSVRLVEAIQYIFDKAGERPCAINVSLGTNGGPHDGTTLVEEAIDTILRAAPNRAVVIAASNSFAHGIHAAGTVAANGQVDLVWEVSPEDETHNELELWYSGRDRFGVELITPTGKSLGKINPGKSGVVQPGNRPLIFVANRLADPNNGDNMIGVYLEGWRPGSPDLLAGQWIVRLHGLKVQEGTFHAWIERDNRIPSQFSPPHDNTHTIGSISCGYETLVVGSYDAHKPTFPLSYFSSAGPTRDGREKPEVSAPGHGVFAAHSRTLTHTIRKSGTSMAAPAVCGIVALMMAQASAQGISLTIQQIRNILTTTANRPPVTEHGWHNRLGHGHVSASQAVAAVMALSSGNQAKSTRKRTSTGKSSTAREQRRS